MEVEFVIQVVKNVVCNKCALSFVTLYILKNNVYTTKNVYNLKNNAYTTKNVYNF